LVTNWPVLHEGQTPEFPDTWRLTLSGAVEQEVSIDWAAFKALPTIETVEDFHCVTTWSRYDNRWAGVAVAEILALVRPLPEARHVTLHCYDQTGYTTNMSLHDFSRASNLFATTHDGQPLAPDHGGPIRFVCHHLYAWKSAKWVCGVEFRTDDKRGYWEERGYHNHADPWLEERYVYQED